MVQLKFKNTLVEHKLLLAEKKGWLTMKKQMLRYLKYFFRSNPNNMIKKKLQLRSDFEICHCLKKVDFCSGYCMQQFLYFMIFNFLQAQQFAAILVNAFKQLSSCSKIQPYFIF